MINFMDSFLSKIEKKQFNICYKKIAEVLDNIKREWEKNESSIKIYIYNYDEIKEYKKLENEVNLLILQINNRLKKIKDSRSCCHENN